jgi:hypothetical protein
MGASDGLKAMGRDLGNSITGNIEPAYVVVHDFRKAGSASGGEIRAEDISNVLRGAPAASAGGGLGGPVEKLFRVQYNPSELEVYAHSKNVKQKDARSAGNGAESNILMDTALAGSLELSMSLWFDKMKPANAFMTAKDTSLAGGVRGAVNMLSEEESVQDETEGFIAALRNPLTQFVTLHWADFSFTGVLTSVNAQYTMFSVSGLPVRAKVAIRVRQEMGKTHTSEFFKDFDKAFSGDQSSLVLAEQRTSNLLNLSL